MKILIADDERYTREGLAEGIKWEEMGIYELLQARNGAEALNIANWYRPDIILTDIRMPKMDGIAFAEAIHEASPETEIIFMSGYMEINYLKSALKLSVIDYIEKPVDLRAVSAAIKKAVEKIRDKEEHLKLQENRKEYLRYKMAAMLAGKNPDWDTLAKISQDTGFPMDKRYVCIIIADWKKSVETLHVESEIDRITASQGFPVLFRKMEEGKYQVIVAYDMGNEHLLKRVYREMAEIGEGIHIGVGFEAENLRRGCFRTLN